MRRGATRVRFLARWCCCLCGRGGQMHAARGFIIMEVVEAALPVMLFVLPANFRAWPLATAFLCPHPRFIPELSVFVARRAPIARVMIEYIPVKQCVYIAPSFALCGCLPRPFSKRLHDLRVVALSLPAQQPAPPPSPFTILPRTSAPLRRARTARVVRHLAPSARRCVSMPCAWSPFRSPRSSLPRPLPP